MKRTFALLTALFIALPFSVNAQQGAAALRDYVGLINQSYHPGMVSYFESVKKEYEKQGETGSAKAIDLLLKGAFGSGFVYSAGGNFYIITNNHVVAQAHTVSITFERSDETKVRIDNLKIIAADEDADLAILALPAGQRPPAGQGLTLLTRAVEEGESAFSAGFPGLGMTPIWQFGSGMISNATVRFPKSIDDQTMMGPYIQHTAQVDDGNSGGPLLVALRSAPSGYAVAGVNTLSGTRRQAANYSVPISTLQPFINNALNPRPATYRAALDERLKKFTEGLGANNAVFTHINNFLSAQCVGENIEYAFPEMRDKASRAVIRTFIEHSREDIIGAMGLAVAWTIENNIRSQGAIKAEIKDVVQNGDDYTVVFTINNKEVSSVWMREYGNWRIKTFGTVAAGDPSLIQKRSKDKKTSQSLKVDSDIFLELGFAHCFDRAPAALYASVDFTSVSINLFWASQNIFNIGMGYCFNIPVPAGDVGFIPNFKFGVNYTHYNYLGNEKESFSDSEDDVSINPLNFVTGISFFGQAGLKFTTSFVPGLFFSAAFQYNFNFFSLLDEESKLNMFKMAVMFGIGYAF